MFRAGEYDFAADFLPFPSGPEGHLRNRRYGSERLPAEAEGQNIFEVFSRCYFRGCMALEAENGIVRSHPAAVVYHLDQGPTGVLDHDGNLRRPGVEGVFHQLFYNGGGPLNDLPRRYHISNVAWQYPQFHPLEKFVKLCNVNQYSDNQKEGYDTDYCLGTGSSAACALVGAVPECTSDRGTGDICPFFLCLGVSPVDIAEHCPALFLFRIIVPGLIVEDPVLLVPEKAKIKSCHCCVVYLNYKNKKNLLKNKKKAFAPRR